MLEEGINGHEAIVTGFGPEIVRSKHGDRSEHTKPSGSQPHPTSKNEEQGPAEFDNNGCGGPKPCRLKTAIRLLRTGAGKTEGFLVPADQERRDERNPGRRREPWPR